MYVECLHEDLLGRLMFPKYLENRICAITSRRLLLEGCPDFYTSTIAGFFLVMLDCSIMYCQNFLAYFLLQLLVLKVYSAY